MKCREHGLLDELYAAELSQADHTSESKLQFTIVQYAQKSTDGTQPRQGKE